MKAVVSTTLLSLVISTSVAAHVTLETKQAQSDSTYKAVMRIAHGCDGEATLKVQIKIPEGVIKVKPMPKANWTLQTLNAKYENTYSYHGKEVTDGVKEIIWSGTLENDHYDEFIFRARITDAFNAGDIVYFPAIQTCASGKNEWIEIPVDEQKLKRPAPALEVLEGDVKKHH